MFIQFCFYPLHKPRSLTLYLMNLNSCVQSRLFQIHSCMLQNLVLKASYLHYFVAMEQIVVFLVGPGQKNLFIILLTTKLETLTLSWAISNAPTFLTSTAAWEKLVVLDQIQDIWIFPFCFLFCYYGFFNNFVAY